MPIKRRDFISLTAMATAAGLITNLNSCSTAQEKESAVSKTTTQSRFSPKRMTYNFSL